MAVLSKLESLPSELLESVTDYLCVSSDIKAWRITSERLSNFGGLFETLNVYVMKDSISRLAFVAQHPVLRKDVRKIVIWLPLFYQTLVEQQQYNRALVKQQTALQDCCLHRDEYQEGEQWEIHAPHYYNRLTSALDQTRGLISRSDPVQNYNDEEMDAGRAHYKAYYDEQQEILTTGAHVTALTAALPKFPSLKSFVIGYAGANTPHKDIPNLNLNKNILWILGHDLPRGEKLPENFIHQILSAIATSNIKLHSFELDPSVWNPWSELPASGLRTVSMTDSEFSTMMKVFKPLRRLTFGFKATWQEAEEEQETIRTQLGSRGLYLPQLRDFKLTVPIPTGAKNFEDFLPALRSWTGLCCLELYEHLDICAEDLILFLRGSETLRKVWLGNCGLREGIRAWKGVLEVFREWRTGGVGREIRLWVLRDEWGDWPFGDEGREEEAVAGFVEGWTGWTEELELVYEEGEGEDEDVLDD